jgi:hypothetical protein
VYRIKKLKKQRKPNKNSYKINQKNKNCNHATAFYEWYDVLWKYFVLHLTSSELRYITTDLSSSFSFTILTITINVIAGRLRARFSMWSLIFFLFNLPIYLLATLGPGVCSAFNIHEYHKHNKCFWEVECGRCMRLITSPPALDRLSSHRAILNISLPYRNPRSIMRVALLLLLYFYTYFLIPDRITSWQFR